jgi:hypothetical protein
MSFHTNNFSFPVSSQFMVALKFIYSFKWENMESTLLIFCNFTPSSISLNFFYLIVLW